MRSASTAGGYAVIAAETLLRKCRLRGARSHGECRPCLRSEPWRQSTGLDDSRPDDGVPLAYAHRQAGHRGRRGRAEARGVSAFMRVAEKPLPVIAHLCPGCLEPLRAVVQAEQAVGETAALWIKMRECGHDWRSAGTAYPVLDRHQAREHAF